MDAQQEDHIIKAIGEQGDKVAILVANEIKRSYAKPEKGVPAMILDNVFRFASAVCLAAILWVANVTLSLDKNMAVMTEQMKILSAQAALPRFTRDQFDAAMLPVNQKIELNAQRITDKTAQMEKINERLINVEKDLYVKYPRSTTRDRE